MYINQKQLDNLKKLIVPGKVILIYGARRCGKTTLIEQYVKTITDKYLLVSGEDIVMQKYLTSQSIEKLKGFVGNNKLIVIDEAQRIANIGINLKLIVDHLPDVNVIATGSSSFDLARNVGEPLTGRKYTLKMFPLSQMEIGSTENMAETEANLESRLIYGSYPEIVTINSNEQRTKYLKEIISSYLFKDILELDGIRHSDKIARLLQLLTFQIGKEVSFTELGTQLGMSKNTIDRYLDLLEKSFVVMRLTGFSRNLRNEITKNPRFYFLDNGIRNALINNFNPIDIRDDIGMLWENYIIMERIKKQEYTGITSNNYFWRTHDQKEIDLIEEREGILHGYEIKWKPQKISAPKIWIESYKNAKYSLINKENYMEFIA